nr:arrestin domain-containing protein 17-like [Nomia melanderi]
MVLCAMSSLRIFRADFERREATYLGGEIVKGNVIIDTTKEKYITELCFIAKGFAKVYWTEEDGDSNSSSYYNSQEYFQIKGILLKSKDEKSKVKITEGYHEYPFEFLLPSNIPSSFEHNIGYVRYTIELVLQRPWKFDHKYKTAFTVISNLDLNLHREKCLGISNEVLKDFCCCFCIKMGAFCVTTQLPSSGYVPGQMIVTTMNYKNLSNNVRILKISAKLETKIEFHATSKTRTKQFEITSNSNSGPFPLEGQVILEIRVPPIPPSFLTFCSIIDLHYNLKIAIHFTGPSKAPPSYEECVSRAQHIKDVGESDYVYGASTPFAPKYPVFNYPVPNTPYK